MRRQLAIVILGALYLGALAACGSKPDSAGEPAPDASATAGAADAERLKEGDLSIQAQLAAGTLLLEDSPLAVDETSAQDLLPLWRAVLSLGSSDTTAPLEFEALLNQLQDTMGQAQVLAISEMELSQERLQTMLQEGELDFGFGRSSSDQSRGDSADGSPEGGFPGGGFPNGPLIIEGGGEGFPGGGPGGGGFQGAADPDALATRQAEFAGNGLLSAQDRMLVAAVIRLLESKTGELSQRFQAGPLELAVGMVSQALNLTQEQVRTQLEAGSTLAQIIEEHGGDVDQLLEQLVQALSEAELPAGVGVESLAAQLLGLEQ